MKYIKKDKWYYAMVGFSWFIVGPLMMFKAMFQIAGLGYKAMHHPIDATLQLMFINPFYFVAVLIIFIVIALGIYGIAGTCKNS